MQYYKYYVSILQELVSTMNKYYDINDVDSVSVILVFISIITIFCMVHKLCELLRNKYSAKEGTDVRVTS
jgi:amino acid permease